MIAEQKIINGKTELVYKEPTEKTEVPKDFVVPTEPTTIEDLVEALDILTSIVLGGE